MWKNKHVAGEKSVFARFLGAMSTIRWPFWLTGPYMVGFLHGAGTEKLSLSSVCAQPKKAKPFLLSAYWQQLTSLRRGRGPAKPDWEKVTYRQSQLESFLVPYLEGISQIQNKRIARAVFLSPGDKIHFNARQKRPKGSSWLRPWEIQRKFKGKAFLPSCSAEN